MIKGIKKADNKLLATILNYSSGCPNDLASVKEKREINLVTACANKRDEKPTWMF